MGTIETSILKVKKTVIKCSRTSTKQVYNKGVDMKTNNYSSDFGYNKKRVDIQLNCKDGLHSYAEIIAAIMRGETVIKCSRPSTKQVYNNALTKKLKSIGIDDIRFCTMSLYVNGGVGYTLYKPKNF